MRGNIDYMRHFPPSGRHAYLGPKEVVDLVKAIDAGCALPANLEKGGRGWRLRVTFNKPEGGVVRRSITIPDEETANWVRNFLVEARNRWREKMNNQRELERAKVKKENTDG